MTTKRPRHTAPTPETATKPKPASPSGWRAPVHGHRAWRPLAPPAPGAPTPTSSWRQRTFGR